MLKLEHHMLLDGKSVMDNALPELNAIFDLLPEALHPQLEKILEGFEDTLAQCVQK